MGGEAKYEIVYSLSLLLRCRQWTWLVFVDRESRSRDRIRSKGAKDKWKRAEWTLVDRETQEHGRIAVDTARPGQSKAQDASEARVGREGKRQRLGLH